MTNQITAAEARDLEVSAMKERGRGGLQERVRTLLNGLGRSGLSRSGLSIEHYHTYDSRKSKPGFPDELILLPRSGRRIAVELKNETAKPTRDQIHWLNAFSACGFEVYLWRPRHLLSGEISRILMSDTPLRGSKFAGVGWRPSSTWDNEPRR